MDSHFYPKINISSPYTQIDVVQNVYEFLWLNTKQYVIKKKENQIHKIRASFSHFCKGLLGKGYSLSVALVYSQIYPLNKLTIVHLYKELTLLFLIRQHTKAQ